MVLTLESWLLMSHLISHPSMCRSLSKPLKIFSTIATCSVELSIIVQIYSSFIHTSAVYAIDSIKVHILSAVLRQDYVYRCFIRLSTESIEELFLK